MKHRIALFVVLTALLGAAGLYFNTVHQPDRSTDAALGTVNGGDETARAARAEAPDAAPTRHPAPKATAAAK